ncbi:MAG: hypothetical protein JRI23_03250 [Deltaproteobacteria bacterium]|jgi:3-oxoacyl-[acyl-carrier-protein] synthase-1|nr:hypothetical protein [Deltaproteobacteria bacterium]MBW2530526.1 hypothetical protein [Deltaproteobacteria bacterium]
MMAAESPRLAVTGLAAVTPLGHDAAASCAAIRARLSGFSEHPIYAVRTRDPEWDEIEKVKAAIIPGLPLELEGRDRLVELSLWVLRDLVRSTGVGRTELERAALLLALPALDEVTDRWALAELEAELRERAGMGAFVATELDHGGHPSALRLLARAEKLCTEGQSERCVLVSVDSHYSPARLALLDAQARLRTVLSPDGFLPGEAAVAMLLEPEAGCRRQPLLRVGSVGFGSEPQPFASQRASTARGLQLAVEAALDGCGAPSAATEWALCDLNGESYRSFEWGTLRGRLASRFAPTLHLHHPADCIGDAGAATGGLLVACTAQAFARGYAPARQALLWTSGEDDARAAVCVEAPPSGS